MSCISLVLFVFCNSASPVHLTSLVDSTSNFISLIKNQSQFLKIHPLQGLTHAEFQNIPFTQTLGFFLLPFSCTCPGCWPTLPGLLAMRATWQKKNLNCWPDFGVHPGGTGQCCTEQKAPSPSSAYRVSLFYSREIYFRCSPFFIFIFLLNVYIVIILKQNWIEWEAFLTAASAALWWKI